MTSPSLKLLISATAFLIAAGLSGCSADSSPPPAPTPSSRGQAAGRVCNSLLKGQAAPALERLTDSKHFSESSLNLSEKIRDISQAEEKLLGDSSFEHRGKEFDLCLPVATDESTAGQLTVSTQWLELRTGDYTWNSHGDWTSFDITGSNKKDATLPYASASSKTSWFAFRCPVGPGSKKNTVLSVNTLTFDLKETLDDRAAEDLTLINYGAAVKLAKQMGCFKESKLPEKLGTLKKFA